MANGNVVGTCCYARSEKHWITDPQGIAWEHVHTLENIPVFHEAAPASTGADRCAERAPAEAGPAAPRGRPVGVAVKPAGNCC